MKEVSSSSPDELRVRGEGAEVAAGGGVWNEGEGVARLWSADRSQYAIRLAVRRPGELRTRMEGSSVDPRSQPSSVPARRLPELGVFHPPSYLRQPVPCPSPHPLEQEHEAAVTRTESSQLPSALLGPNDSPNPRSSQ